MSLDALRLSVGTLTVLPTKPPASVDRDVAGRAMTMAPLVGALLAILTATFLWLLGWGPSAVPVPSPWVLGAAVHPMLTAALAIGLLAVSTRAMHLDGLADTADGLGSGRPAVEALEIMRRGDVGPFGVVTLALVLVLQVVSLGVLVAQGLGPAGLLVALVVSRLTLPMLCYRSIPAARRDGLGSAVAGSVGPGRLVLATALTPVVLAVMLLSDAERLDGRVLVSAVAASVFALLVAGMVARRAVRRLGGVTGDVLGAGVEAAFTTVLVVLTILT